MMQPAAKLTRALTPVRLAALLIVPVLAVLTAFDAWRDIVHIAIRDEEASHALLVPIVVGWLVWVRRRLLVHSRWRGGWVGTLIVVAGAAIYLWGDIRAFETAWHVGAVVLLLGAVISVLGRDVLVNFLPAVLAVCFVLPVPGRVRQRVAIPMETATAAVTEKVYETLDLPIERSANTLSVNGRDVDIVEACNGLRMVIALTLVSYAFAFGTPLRWYVRLAVIVLSPVSAILCNVIRLIPTVWFYGYHPGKFASNFHDLSGWVMLFVSFFILMGLIRILRWALVPVNQYVLAYD